MEQNKNSADIGRSLTNDDDQPITSAQFKKVDKKKVKINKKLEKLTPIELSNK